MTRFSPAEPTLSSLLHHAVVERGDSIAFVSCDHATTFAELEKRVLRVATGLRALGIGRGDCVAIWLPNIPAWIEAEFALARLGAIAVGVNARYGSHEIEDMIARSAARALVFQPHLGHVDCVELLDRCDHTLFGALETLLPVDGEVHDARVARGRRVVPYGELQSAGDDAASDAALPGLVSNVFTSSGTTSAPKLVMHSQAALAGHAVAVADAFGYARAPDATILAMLPLCGVFGFNTVMAAIAAMRPTILLPSFDAAQAVAEIERHHVTHTTGSDEMFRRVFAAANPVRRISSLREGAFADFGGEAEALVTRGREIGIKIFQTYGSSEVQALMTYPHANSGPERWMLGAGAVFDPGLSVRVCDPQSAEPVGIAQHGEIEIKGPNVTVGYLHDPVAWSRAFTADGYFRTGDLGYLESEHEFVYLARMGDALRLGGFLVDPREIEARLEREHGVAAAQVVAARTPRGTRAVAFVVPSGGVHLSEGQLIGACAQDMARYKVPKRVVVVERFPTTQSANGQKIRKTELRAMAQALIDATMST